MAFVLTGIGLVLIITGVRDTHALLGAQLVKDFTGQRNFTVWVLAIGSIGAVGYIREFRTFSHYFLSLIIVSMVLSNQGFFQKFSEQFAAGPKPINANVPGAVSTNPPATDTPSGPSFFQSLKKPEGGGFWDWSGIPSPFGN